MVESYEVRIAGNLPPGLIAQKARELGIFLNQQGVATRPAEQAAKPGGKGVLADLGTLIVDHAVGPAWDAFLDLLKRYVLRERGVEVVLTRPDGARIAIITKNVGGKEVAEIVELAKGALS
jgi:hypothetical protein